MKIGYDISILEEDRFTGVEKLAFYLFSSLWQQHQAEHLLFCRRRPQRLTKLPDNARLILVPWGKFWRWRGLARQVKREKPDVFISPVSALPGLCGVPLVAYVHECAWRYDVGEGVNWRHRFALWLAAIRCKALLVNSQKTRDDVCREPFCRHQRLEIISPAADPAMTGDKSASSEALQKIGVYPGQYCLFVSTIRRKKNVDLLIEAFSRPALQHIPLVCAGRIDDPSLLSLARQRGGNIQFTGYLPDEAIRYLYQNALCFLYVSRNEGFGLPILEAFANNCPVIAAKTGSIPEVAEKAALYLRDFSVECVTECVLSLAENKNLRAKLVRQGQKRTAHYNWEKSARKLYSLLCEIGGTHC